MSNESYSKSQVILEAVRSILVGDDSNTGNEVREIDFYCGDRVYRGMARVKNNFPQITLNVEEGLDDNTIPTGDYFLESNVHVKYDDETPQDKLDNVMARILFLINKKPDQLNLATGKSLRCRYLVKLSVTQVADSLERIFTKTARFRLICDDEIIN